MGHTPDRKMEEMGSQIIALLKVIAVLGGSVAIFALALKIASPWIVAGGFAAAAGVGLWVRSRRICCYLCRGGLESGSIVCRIGGRRRLICRACWRTNGLPLSGEG
ncbi:MAG TPA: hypothetical protein VF791_01270 [Pyrinomonadaceae bacterium]